MYNAVVLLTNNNRVDMMSLDFFGLLRTTNHVRRGRWIGEGKGWSDGAKSDRMMKSFELMKSDKVTEQSDSWFPARSADLLVACSLSHTVPKWYSGATVAKWYSGAAQCYNSATPLILSNRSIPPSARGALYIAAVLRINFDLYFRSIWPTDFRDGYQAEQEDGGHLKHPKEGRRHPGKGEWPLWL